MAEITSSSEQRGSGTRAFLRKRSTKIDMTPMVDLAFLLLTFFILTTAFHKNRVMELTMPDKSGPSAPVSAENVLNLVLGEDDRIFWWVASEGTARITDYSREGVRRVLLDHIGENPRMIVLIKPLQLSKFQNIVDILDEMTITGAKRFAIVDIEEEDKVLIAER